MRVSTAAREDHTAAILAAAERLFRERGFDGAGVAEVARAAGLTHGAVYNRFPGKAALAAAALRNALLAAADLWRERAERARAAGRDPFGALIDAYLQPAHRDNLAEGCPIATLGPEAAREPGPLADALAEGTAALAAELANALPASMPPADRARAATAALSAMNGGLILSRALRGHLAASDAALACARVLARAAVHLFSDPPRL
ncbi:MAG: TetR/AcrR family transcriptional regulator [Rhodospirillales bacterium]|nr:TetR/AcrR family transcriptional regulator [Rhodospirillales bacterium]